MVSGDPYRLLDVLSSRDVPFVIIGGHAVTFHGFVRATEDTDVVFRRTPESELQLLAALSEVNACWIGDEIDPETGIERLIPVSLPYIRASRLMMLVTDLGFVDLFDYIPGLPNEPVQRLVRYGRRAGATQVRFAALVARHESRRRPAARPDRSGEPPRRTLTAPVFPWGWTRFAGRVILRR
jgi:hypothetical protein